MSFKHYLTNKLNLPNFRFTDILSTTHLPNRKRLSQAFRHHIVYRANQLPPKVDLRPEMTPVENQSSIGSSVANSLAGAYEYLIKKTNGLNTDVSRLFIYYNARVKANQSDAIIDSGCSVTNAIEALEEFGTCLESLWPYDISCVNTRPDDQAYEQAENHKINKALQININLHEMKSCIAQGFPFAFGLQLYKSFDKAAKNGIVPIPKVWKQDKKSIGSHALLAVGYSDRSEAFIVRNSWGEDWGDQGYCYIPYDYITNPNLCFDVWTIQKLTNDDFDQAHWHFHDTVNYLNDNDGPIETFDEDYLIGDDNEANWRGYYHRKRDTDDSWDRYRNFQRNDYSRNDDDYLDDRYRRNRYDRDNEPFDQPFRGYSNSGFNTGRNFSYPMYDRFLDEDNKYNQYDYDQFGNDHGSSMF